MTVGIDTYVTVAEADEYISTHYRSNSKDRKRWNELETEDKEVLLVNACTELETLPFQGRKAVVDQPLSFPRLPMQYGRTDEGAPANVKAAQIELALWLSDEEKQVEIAQRVELQGQGVQSFSVGNLSESYNAPITHAALKCSKAKVLLSRYLNGGYAIC